MKSKENSQPENINDPSPYTFSDQVTRKKIKKHLQDIHDVITEDDIKNVKIPGEETNTSTLDVEIDKQEVKDDNSVNEEKEAVFANHDTVITPWDILAEPGLEH
jgi:hypothetical protein